MLDRKTPPPFNRSTSFTLLEPVKIVLPSGLNVQFISGGEQEIIKIELILKAGRWQEENWGVSYFTANLLSKGTAAKTSFDIAQIFDRYGAHLEVAASYDIVSVSLYSLTKDLEPVLQLLLEVLTTPVFPEKELQQGKSIYLENLKVNQEKTSFLASKLIRRNIFGDTHPYGKEVEEIDVNRLTRIQLVEFYKKFFSPFQVFVSGKIDERTQKVITDSLAALKIFDVREKTYVPETSDAAQSYLEKEGSVQTSLRLGKRSILRSHTDYTDVLFLNHILGGYFGSRLMKNIREEKGLTYGIHSSLHALQHDSYLVIGADVNKENRELTVQEIKNELRKLRSEKITLKELDTTRFHFIGSLQTEITTPFAHAEKIKNIILHKLHPEYYNRMIARIAAITPDELLITAEKYFHEASFLEVAAG